MLRIIHKSKIPVSVWILLNCTELSYSGCLLQNVCKVSAENLQIQVFVKTDCCVHVLNVTSLCCWLASAPESWRQNPKTERAGRELPIPRNDNFCEMVSTFISVCKILKGLLVNSCCSPAPQFLKTLSALNTLHLKDAGAEQALGLLQSARRTPCCQEIWHYQNSPSLLSSTPTVQCPGFRVPRQYPERKKTL